MAGSADDWLRANHMGAVEQNTLRLDETAIINLINRLHGRTRIHCTDYDAARSQGAAANAAISAAHGCYSTTIFAGPEPNRVLSGFLKAQSTHEEIGRENR